MDTCGMLLGMMLALLSKRKEITQKKWFQFRLLQRITMDLVAVRQWFLILLKMKWRNQGQDTQSPFIVKSLFLVSIRPLPFFVLIQNRKEALIFLCFIIMVLFSYQKSSSSRIHLNIITFLLSSFTVGAKEV